MQVKRLRARRLVGYFLLYTLILNGLIGLTGELFPVLAQKRVIVVNADQPNIWTLEQAHYLLAQMHRRNLDLKAKSLEDLDPNEIAGLRFDVMRMLVEFGATFNQADLASNRMFSRNEEFNTQRREELLTERDGLRKESLTLTGDIDELETKKADAESEADKARLDAKIASKKNRLTKVDKEIENINGELGTLNSTPSQRTATTGGAEFNAEKLPKSVFDEAFKQAAAAQIEKFNQAPKLNASLRLDNFLQMQYEIIAKQLSLLRDELGPGERLLFLELPQTVNVAHHEADKKWAQSWWKIAGYTKRERRGEPTAIPSPTPAVLANQEPITTAQDFNSILNGTPIPLPIESERPCVAGAPITYTDTRVIKVNDSPSSTAPTPSSLYVSARGRVTNVSVTLTGLRHPHPDDLDILLVGPQGQNALIMSDVGGTALANGLTITLDDSSAGPLPDAGPITAPNYQPTNVDDPASPDNFPTGTPAPLGGSALSVFNGTDPDGLWKLYVMDDSGPVEGSISGGWSLSITTDCALRKVDYQVAYEDVFYGLGDRAAVNDPNLSRYLAANDSDLSNRMVRTIDLIPRQSSLNVNDMKLQTHAGAFNFVLSTLFGFGSRLNIQRQREQFAQFVQQELYSSAFGKGSREFGWTFTPMPGMDRLQSGVRTTYAVVVVPDDATSLVLESNGCYFPRSAYQPASFEETRDPDWNIDNRTSRNCGGERTQAFVVPIPSATINGSNDFWVDRVWYQPVGKGERIVVLISGKNFSSQIGVLINGIPLIHSIGMAQPLMRDDSQAGRLTGEEFKDVDIPGRIERIDANKLVFSFKMPKDFEGTPAITLVAPGKAIDINWLTNILVNGKPRTLSPASVNACSDPPAPGCVEVAPDMFKGDPVRPLRIESVEVFRRPHRTVNVLVTGAGFDEHDTLFVNGVEITGAFVSKTLLSGQNLPAPSDDKIQVTLKAGDKTIKATAVINPMQLKIDKVTVVSYDAAGGRKPGVLVVKIDGNGFIDNLQSSPRKVRLNVTSKTEAYLTIPSPNETEVVTLTDPVTNLSVSTVVARKPPPE